MGQFRAQKTLGQFDLKTSRIHNRWPIAKEGLPFVLLSWGLFAVFAYFGLIVLSAITALLALFVLYFFRDPERTGDSTDGAVLTPADGKVLEVKQVGAEGNNPLWTPAVKVSIFMSVFNVHVNRTPVSGTVKSVVYSPGKFFSANLDKASEQNENNRIVLETPDARTVGLIQIAGLVARRIACWVEEGDRVAAGQRFGLIRFGSRVELFLPIGSRVAVQPGQKVKAGETVIGYLS